MQLLREIVNGGLLGHSIGRKVSIIGTITNTNPNGKSFEMKTVDNMLITVNLSSVLDDMIEGYVEVHGICQSGKVINAEEYIHFTPEQTEGFDIEGHNKLCALLQQVQDDAYKTC